MPRSARRYWLLKSEPNTFSYDDLERAKKKTTPWDGVRNYRARNFMRDEMRVGDGILYYHSNADPPGVAGVAEVASESYPDATQFDPADSHFDPGSKQEDPRWWLIDVRAVKKLPRFVSMTVNSSPTSMAADAVEIKVRAVVTASSHPWRRFAVR